MTALSRQYRATPSLSQQQRGKLVRIVFFLCILAILGIALVMGVRRLLGTFAITTIHCYVGVEECQDEYATAVATLHGKYIWSNIAQVLQEPAIQVKRQYPHTVLVQYPKLPILTTISDASGTQLRAIRADGKLVAASESVAGIVIIDEVAVAQPLGSSLDETRKTFYSEVSTLVQTFPFSSLQGITVISRDQVEWQIGTVIAVTRMQEVKKQLQSLQVVFSTPTIEIENRRVDLRFNQPVIQ